MTLPIYTYDIDRGPLDTSTELAATISRGNCRLAIQVYFYRMHNLWLRPDQVLCPALYRSTGCFVEDDISKSSQGDIILAERIRNKEGRIIDRSRSSYATEDEWIISLHSAVLIVPESEKREAHIWHATAIAGGTCEWSRSVFERYYRIVAIKRLTSN